MFDSANVMEGSDLETAPTLKSGGSRGPGGTHREGNPGLAGDTVPLAFVKRHGANTADDHETWEEADVARTLNNMGQAGTNGALVADPVIAQGHRMEADSVVPTLRANGGKDRSGKAGNRTDKQPMTVEGAAVRRLTPTECERLQSFPDGWTVAPR